MFDFNHSNLYSTVTLPVQLNLREAISPIAMFAGIVTVIP